MNPNSPINPTAPNPSVAPVAPVTPANSPIPNQTPTDSAPSQPTPAQSNFSQLTHKWYFWTILILALFTIVSVVIAAYALSQHASMQEEINQLKSTVAEKEALVAKYAALIGQKVEDSSQSGYIDDSKTTTQDFIYIGEWGLRFKIPSDLINLSYTFETNITEAVEATETTEAIPARKTETLCVTGMPKAATRQPEYYQMGITEASLGCIVKQPDNNLGTDSQARSVYQDGTSYYIYHRAQNLKSIHEEDRIWETEATELVQELLAKNITKF